MSKGRVLTKKKWRNGQRRKPRNTCRSFKFPGTSRFHKESDGVHLSMRDSWKIPIDLEWTKYWNL